MGILARLETARNGRPTPGSPPVRQTQDKQVLREDLPFHQDRIPAVTQQVYDTVIIGGGVVGLATAYCLAEAGIGPLLIVERGDVAGEASAANNGGVWPEFEGLELSPDFRRLGKVSRDLFLEWSQQDGMDFEFRENGVLVPAFTEEELHELKNSIDACVDEPLEHAMVAPADIRKIEPVLSHDIIGGAFFDREVHVNPLKVCCSLAGSVRRRGVEIRAQCPVQGADCQGDSVKALHTADGPVHADRFIDCAGPWASYLPGLALELPIQPGRGQGAVTEKAPPLLNTCTFYKVGLFQLVSGNFLLGGTLAYTGFDTAAPPENLEVICGFGAKMFPRLREFSVLRTWARLRPVTPDEMPLVGLIPGYDNLYINAGHFRNGLLLAPVCGRLLADHLASGEETRDLAVFSPTRFPHTSEASEEAAHAG